MIVPGNNNPLKGTGRSEGRGNVVPMQRPSETQLLMALAEMHRQGAFSEGTGRSASEGKGEDAR